MKCKFTVGQRVVCIGDGWRHMWTGEPTPPPIPVKGQIYTIREMEAVQEFVGLRFEEIVRAPIQTPSGAWVEDYWDHAMFRPLDEDNVDLSIFHKILDYENLKHSVKQGTTKERKKVKA